MNYKVNFLDERSCKWRHIIINEVQLWTGDFIEQIKHKFDLPGSDISIYKIEAITEG